MITLSPLAVSLHNFSLVQHFVDLFFAFIIESPARFQLWIHDYPSHYFIAYLHATF